LAVGRQLPVLPDKQTISEPRAKRANDEHSFRFALAIRQCALGLTKKHNFISPHDD
jgi:hypothetical protein